MCRTGLVPEATVRDCWRGVEAGCADGKGVETDGDLLQIELTDGVGFGFECEVRLSGVEGDVRLGDGAMLGIVHDAVEVGKDGGVRSDADGDEEKQETRLTKETQQRDLIYRQVRGILDCLLVGRCLGKTSLRAKARQLLSSFGAAKAVPLQNL